MGEFLHLRWVIIEFDASKETNFVRIHSCVMVVKKSLNHFPSIGLGVIFHSDSSLVWLFWGRRKQFRESTAVHCNEFTEDADCLMGKEKELKFLVGGCNLFD